MLFARRRAYYIYKNRRRAKFIDCCDLSNNESKFNHDMKNNFKLNEKTITKKLFNTIYFK
ncbi:MAG: hypothetical protein ACI9FW_001896 [Flavobacterium sp.]|jgi:hypothetical protein